jgi:hypothetical protein
MGLSGSTLELTVLEDEFRVAAIVRVASCARVTDTPNLNITDPKR